MLMRLLVLIGMLALLVTLVRAVTALADDTAAPVKLIPGHPGATLEGARGYNIFDPGPGGVTTKAPAGAINRIVFGAASDSDQTAHDHILSFSVATDVLDLSAICHGKCSGPYFMDCQPKCFDKGKGAVYYQYLPEQPNGYYTAVFGDFAGTGHPDFYVAIEGGKLALSRRNFEFGARP